jgi:large subunit ribosomal protein L23
MEHAQVIIKPLLSEKSTRLQHTRNTYTFLVATVATKPQIKAAVEALYNVKVEDVRTVVRKGKPKRSKYREVVRSDTKRALVSLAGESKIELF